MTPAAPDGDGGARPRWRLSAPWRRHHRMALTPSPVGPEDEVGPLAGADAGRVYRLGLEALVPLLRAAGEERWAGWAQANLERWAAGGGVAGHLAAYGGEGSVSDLRLVAARDAALPSAVVARTDAVVRALIALTWAAAARMRYGAGPALADFGTARDPVEAPGPEADWARSEVPRLIAGGEPGELVRRTLDAGGAGGGA